MPTYKPLVLVPYAGMTPIADTAAMTRELDIQLRLVNVSRHPYDYWELLRKYWGYPTDLLIVEQHMRVTPAKLLELINCSSNLCTQAYRRSGDFYWCHNVATNPFSEQESRWLTPGMPYAGFSGLGCAKLGASARRGTWLPVSSWERLDLTVSKALKRTWCVHWPGVEHDHPLEDSPPPGSTMEWYEAKLAERGLQR